MQILHKSDWQNFCCLDKEAILIILLQFHVNIGQKVRISNQNPLRNEPETLVFILHGLYECFSLSSVAEVKCLRYYSNHRNVILYI